MEYADLYEFPEGHPPSPYDKPPLVFGADGQSLFAWLRPGFRLLAVGWIERAQFSTGALEQPLLKEIQAICRQPAVSDGYLGVHSCALCGQSRHGKVPAHGHYLLRQDSDVYMFPRFLVHYVVSHKYLPPERFRIALESGVLLGLEDLVTRPLHEVMDELEGMHE